jgi:hypothetical protein
VKNELIIKRSSGFRIKISTRLHVAEFRPFDNGEYFYYSSHVEVCDVGKRKFRPLIHGSESPSSEELKLAKLQLWKMLEPD